MTDREGDKKRRYLFLGISSPELVFACADRTGFSGSDECH